MRFIIGILFLFFVACQAQRVMRVYRDGSCVGDVLMSVYYPSKCTVQNELPCTAEFTSYGAGTSVDSKCGTRPSLTKTDLLAIPFNLNASNYCVPNEEYTITPFSCTYYVSAPAPYVRWRCRNSELQLLRFPDNTCTGVGMPMAYPSSTCSPFVRCPTFTCQASVPFRMSMYAMAVYESQTHNNAMKLKDANIDGSVVISMQRGWITHEWVLVEDLCLDAIVIVLRGTDNPIDWLTNFQFRAEAWENGYIHSGFLARANIIYDEIMQVYGMNDQSRFSKLYITGHSLGAAVASILTKKFAGIVPNVQGFGFATPRVYSGDIDMNTNFMSYVYENDIVPRLTIWSMLDAVQSCNNATNPYLITRLHYIELFIKIVASGSSDTMRFKIPGTLHHFCS